MQYAIVILLVAFSPFLIQAHLVSPVGAPIQAQLSEERKNELIGYCMQTFHGQSNSAFKHIVVNVENITSQVVSGVLYKLDLELAETDCRKGITGKTCNLKAGKKNLKCSFEIHEQKWLNHRAVTVKNCTNK